MESIVVIFDGEMTPHKFSALGFEVCGSAS
jgi:hypothetical protein